MKILGIEHIGIATESIVKTAPFWKTVLNLEHSHSEEIDREGLVTDIYDSGKGKIELLESVDKNSNISKFLKKRGQGIHHLCLEVENIHNAITELKNLKIRLINDTPLKGAENYLVVFIHPESTGGVLVELAEKPK